MQADFRIFVKDFWPRKTLRVPLVRAPFARQFWVRMDGARWPRDGRPVSLEGLRVVAPGGGAAGGMTGNCLISTTPGAGNPGFVKNKGFSQFFGVRFPRSELRSATADLRPDIAQVRSATAEVRSTLGGLRSASGAVGSIRPDLRSASDDLGQRGSESRFMGLGIGWRAATGHNSVVNARRGD